MPKLSELSPDQYEVIEEARPLKLSELNPNQYEVEETPLWESAMRGAAQGMTLGHADEVAAGLGAGVDKAQAMLGMRGDIDLSDAYDTRLKHIRKADTEAKEDNPLTYGGFEMGGAIAPAALIPGGAAASTARAATLATAGGVGAGSGYSEADFGSNQHIFDTTMGGALGLGSFGAIKGSGILGKEALKSNAVKTISEEAKRAAIKARIYAKKSGKKLLSNVGGVEEDHINRYLRRNKDINSVTEDAVKERMDDAIIKRSDDLVSAKDSVRDHLYAKRDAERALREGLRGTKVPESIPKDVMADLDQLRSNISAGSTEGFKALKESDIIVPVANIKDFIEDKLAGLRIGDAAPASSEYATLAKYSDFMDQIGGDFITPVDAKRFIQLLDEDVADAYARAAMPGGRISAGDKSLMSLRSHVSDALKTVPEYADAMAKVAPDVGVLKDAQRYLGNDKRVISAIKNIDNPSFAKERDSLSALGDKFGKKYTDQADEYFTAQEALGSGQKFRSMADELPEAKAYNDSQMGLQSALDRSAEIRGVTTGNSQNFMRRVASDKAPNIENLKKLQALSDDAGTDFMQSAKDIQTQRAFNQDGTRGSRNAVRFGAAGGAIGGIPGAAIGAQVGAYVDKQGTRITKSVLDKMIEAKSNPSKLAEVIQFMPAKYGQTLSNAANKGGASLGASHHILWKNDAKYRALFTDENLDNERDLQDAIDSDYNKYSE